jgi:hypothetical protein
MRSRDLEAGDRFEQRSSLYGLLGWKDKVGWEAAGGPIP